MTAFRPHALAMFVLAALPCPIRRACDCCPSRYRAVRGRPGNLGARVGRGRERRSSVQPVLCGRPDGSERPHRGGVSVSARQLGQDSGYGGFQYPATGDWQTLLTDEFPFLGGAYQSSVDQGRQERIAYMTDRATNFPNEVFVLAGWSMGAQVVGEALEICRSQSAIETPTLRCSGIRP